jgi:HD-GYP domain-containing protein (c-di-GMP phosphodiesterase class II)
MTSDRSYRKAYDLDYYFKEIEIKLGTMYDPIIGRYVLQHWEEVLYVIGNNANAIKQMGFRG